MRQEYKQEYVVLGIAAGGVYARSVTTRLGNSTMKGSVSIPDFRLTPYLGDLIEGGMVIDKRPCIKRDDFINKVINGPLLDHDLPDNTIVRWEGNRTETTTLDQAKLSRSFDHLSLDLYAKVWEDMGARIGIRKGNSIHWNDGTIQAIPSESERYNSEE